MRFFTIIKISSLGRGTGGDLVRIQCNSSVARETSRGRYRWLLGQTSDIWTKGELSLEYFGGNSSDRRKT